MISDALKAEAQRMRDQGVSLWRIAEATGLNVSTVHKHTTAAPGRAFYRNTAAPPRSRVGERAEILGCATTHGDTRDGTDPARVKHFLEIFEASARAARNARRVLEAQGIGCTLADLSKHAPLSRDIHARAFRISRLGRRPSLRNPASLELSEKTGAGPDCPGSAPFLIEMDPALQGDGESS